MDVILSPVKWQFAPVYFDDIVAFSRSPWIYIEHVQRVLSLFGDAEATVNLEKCNFFTGTITFLRHTIQQLCLEIATHITDAIKGLKPPTNITALSSLFELRNFFRPFYSNFARIAAPLNQKLNKERPTHFGAFSANELR